ncbi:site-2 protease family protein [Thermococci archaeon]|nr:MAG: site-2 protease family protein [Thermococci archaeon]
MALGLRGEEIEDLIISFIVLTFVFSNFELKLIPYTALAVFTAFIFHELAHRQVARRYGYVAFYKRWDAGIILALLLGILNKVSRIGFIFAAVGAVYIYAPYQPWEDKEANGKISLAGPVTNIAVGIIALLLLKSVSFSTTLWGALYYTALINFWLAFFNLLPIPPLDGYKVLRWNTGYWAISIGVAFLLQSLV